MRYLAALATAAVLVSGCGSSGTGGSGVVADLATSAAKVAPTTGEPAVAQAGFLVAAGGDQALAGLSNSDLGCVVDELLVVLQPAEVAVLTSAGPSSAQAPTVVEALRSCDLVLEVARLGLAGGFVGDSGTPELDPACVLEGVTEDDMAPVLEALFAGAGAAETDRTVDVLLSQTPVMGNLVRCGLEGLLGQAGSEVPPFCQGLFDQVATMMTVVIEHGVATDVDGADPLLLVELFGLSSEVFVWLADNVPDSYRADAEVVRDASVMISEVMAEALRGLDDPSEPQTVLAAVFGAVARLDAELVDDSFELESARSRLESYVTSSCGDSSIGLFDVLSGTGALSGA